MNSMLDYGQIYWFSVLCAVNLLFHFLLNRGNNYFRIDVLFLLGFVLVHFQWPVMIAVSGIEPEQFRQFDLYTDYILYGTWLSLIGLNFWIWGYNIISTKVNEQKLEERLLDSGAEFKPLLKVKKLFNWTIVIFILFIVTGGKAYLTGQVYKGEGPTTGGDAMSGISGYIHIFLMVFVAILALYTILKSENISKSETSLGFVLSNKRYTIFVFCMSLIFLLAGDRSSAIILLSGVALVFSALVKPVGFKQLMLVIFAGAVLMNMVRLFRTGGVSEVGQFQLSNAYDLTLNLANSARTMYIGLYDFEQRSNELFMGQLWRGNFLGVIPFAQSVFINTTGVPEYMLNTPKYITYVRFGEDAPSGEGTSLIIDIFLNFGKYGVMLIMLLHGLLVSKLQRELNLKKNIKWMLVAVFVGATAFYVGRSSILNPLKGIVWSYFISMFFYLKKPHEK